MFHDVSLSAFVKFVIFSLASRWASPRDAKAWQKLLQFDVKTSCRQANDLFEVMQQPSAPSGEWYWRILLENSVFSPPRTCLTPHSGAERPAIANVTYTSLKSAFNGLRFRRWQYGSIFIRLAVIASETQKNVATFQENWTLQQFKVIQGHRSWCQWKAHMWLPISH